MVRGAWQYALDNRDTGAVPDFQYHHQPFNYFKNYAPGTDARTRHLRDAGLGDDASTNRLIADIDAGRLPAVTFYKPQGNLNMHAGYADVASGDRWGPGSRISALVISPLAKKGYVDHTVYDTNSILRFISRVHDLEPLHGVVRRDHAFAANGAAPLGDLTQALDLA